MSNTAHTRDEADRPIAADDVPQGGEPELLTCENDACDRVYDAADGGLTNHPEPLYLCPACREAYTMGWMDHERTTAGRGLRGWVGQFRRRDRDETGRRITHDRC